MKIEINNQQFFLPERFQDLTMKQYAEVVAADISDEPRIVSIMLGCPVEYVRQFPISVYNEVIGKAAEMISRMDTEVLRPANEVEIEGVKYTINYGEELTIAEWFDTRDAELLDILSVVLRPYGEKYDSTRCLERKELFGRQKCGDILPLISFFIRKRAGYYQNTRYSSLLLQAQALCVEYINSLRKTFGLLKLSTLWLILKLKITIRLSKCSWGRRFLSSSTSVRKPRLSVSRTSTRNNSERQEDNLYRRK